MSNKNIRANTTGKSQVGGDITGSPLAGDKFGLDVIPHNTTSNPTYFKKAPVTKTIYNETIAAANVEQSLALSANIQGYMIRSRGNGILKLSHVSGESGTKYITIPKNATYTDDNAYQNLTIYFQCNIIDVIEVVTWE